MAETPESKVKKKVTAILKQHGAYYAYVVASGFGNAGIPDILACHRGRFLGIECKAKGGKPTTLQLHNLAQISKAGGLALVIDETNMEDLIHALTETEKTGAT
mgnify:FL=1